MQVLLFMGSHAAVHASVLYPIPTRGMRVPGYALIPANTALGCRPLAMLGSAKALAYNRATDAIVVLYTQPPHTLYLTHSQAEAMWG